jgi:short-subunit dehydrogenase
VQLKNKKILITGAGSGIGRAIAIELSSHNNQLILCGRNLEKLNETQNLLKQQNAFCCAVDIQSSQDRQLLVQQVSDELGGLDVLINNAGVVHVGSLQEISDHDIEQMMRTNLIAPIQLIRDFLPLLNQSKAPALVNVGSMFGDIAYPLFSIYSATKFGLRGLSDALRRELSSQNIKVIYAAPRATKTGASSSFEKLIKPFGMALDTPEVVARHIVTSIERGKTSIYPKTKEHFFLYVQRLFPKLVDQNVRKKIKNLKV